MQKMGSHNHIPSPPPPSSLSNLIAGNDLKKEPSIVKITGTGIYNWF
jgi:hypothetical protein